MPSPTATKAPQRRRTRTKSARPRAVASHTSEILGALDVHNTLTGLEARIDSMEIDLTRHEAARDEDGRRFAGELAVMKARVEDALDAFAATADELRALARDVDAKIKVKKGGAAGTKIVRAELEARIDGVAAGIGDVLTDLSHDLSARVAAMSDQLDRVTKGLEQVMSSVSDLPARVAALEASGRKR